MLSVVTGSAEGIENKGIASRHQAEDVLALPGKRRWKRVLTNGYNVADGAEDAHIE